LVISDDASIDETLSYLSPLAERSHCITLLPASGPFGSAAKNFYRLLRDADFGDADYIAFADQDDIWLPGKLAKAVAMLRQYRAVAVSSNVTAFWPDGRRQLVEKAQPQRRWDYLFESAGPGCTYVMTADFARTVRDHVLQIAALGLPLPAYHDWLCYALCRVRGEVWAMDPSSTMDYRQHGGNEVGANSGFKAAVARKLKVSSGGWRREVLGMVRMASTLRPEDVALGVLANRLERGNWADRWVLASQVGQFRRSRRDRLALAFFFLSGLFWGR
jgi:rhamnosyltransferase